MTLGAVCEALAGFTAFGIVLPTIDGAGLRDYRPDELDIAILPRDLRDERPWLLDDVPASQISYASKELSLSEDEVRARLLRFAPLGIRIVE